MAGGRDAAGPQERTGPRAWAALFGVFLGVALAVYAASLRGDFLSDDYAYVAHNPLVHGLSLDRLGPIFDPRGAGVAQTLNYAPVHLLLHAGVWQLAGAETLGHHLANVVLHALVSVLLVAFFLRAGMKRPAACLGGLLFLVHPANVEAVAWIFQLKTVASMALALAALLALRRHPSLATVAFALALLTKITAAVALPVALALIWTDPGRRLPSRREWAWLATWTLLVLVVGGLEWQAGQRAGVGEASLGESPAVHLRTICAIVARYAVMAATSIGLSSFHEPPPAESLVDPWWLAGLAAIGFGVWRGVASLRAREREAVYWVFAAASWLPVSQVVPFPFPVADRYLYGILPGLIGLALLAASRGVERLEARLRARRGQGAQDAPAGLGPAGWTALLLALGVAAGSSLRAADRAGVWRSGALLMADAAVHYPDGSQASLLRATGAARRGDASATATHLRAALEGGYVHFAVVLEDPTFARVLRSPEVRAVILDMAAWWTARAEELEDPTQEELWRFARAHLVRGEPDRARELLEEGLRKGGPNDAVLQAELDRIGPAGQEPPDVQEEAPPRPAR